MNVETAMSDDDLRIADCENRTCELPALMR